MEDNDSMATSILDAERVRYLLCYTAETGVFVWRNPQSNVVRPGAVAGMRHSNGYTCIGVDGRRYFAHRLAWLHHYGEPAGAWPACQIDHINRDKADNRICNLRIVSPSGNKQNMVAPHAHNRVGRLGVKRNGKSGFMAQIWVEGKSMYLGTYRTIDLAEQAYLTAKAKHHTEGCPQ